MPGIYRAPEVILGMEWDFKVDIWSAGVMVINFTSPLLIKNCLTDLQSRHGTYFRVAVYSSLRRMEF